MAKKVGEILVELGFLKEHHIDEILQLMHDEPGKLFGEIALAHGYISNEAINAYINYKEKEASNS